MISTFTIVFLLCIFGAYKISKGRILFNDAFWLLVCWILIIGMHFVSGVKWKYDVSADTVIYILVSFLGYYIFRYIGLHSKINSDVVHRDISQKRYNQLKALGWVGVVVFSADYIRLNGLFNIGKSQYSISIIGSIASFLIPILLVTGLFEICSSYIAQRKISIKAVCSLVGYTLPCILNSGRESLLYVVIGFIATLFFGIDYLKEKNPNNRRKLSVRKMVSLIVAVIVVFAVGTAIFSSSLSRFGNNEVNAFLYTHTVPSHIIAEAKKFGPYEFLYYNLVSYFGHQLPFLEYIIQNYNGPYLIGMYELNILSRRLPSSWGLDYRLIYSNIDSAFSGSWQTILGSFVFDFGKIATPILCCMIGLVVGRNRRRFKLNPTIERATLNSLICIAMFTTIQLGPFYNFLVYGSFIWWYIIFGDKKTQRLYISFS